MDKFLGRYKLQELTQEEINSLISPKLSKKLNSQYKNFPTKRTRLDGFSANITNYIQALSENRKGENAFQLINEVRITLIS